MVCHYCGSSEKVQLENSRTAYSREPYTLWMALIYDDKEVPDPNAPIPLCRNCAVEHHQHWDSMWQDYYATVMTY